MRFTKSAAFFLALAAHTIGKTCSALLFIHLSGVCTTTSGPAALWGILLALNAVLAVLQHTGCVRDISIGTCRDRIRRSQML